MPPAITELLDEKGPLTGSEIEELTGREPLDLWRECHRTDGLHIVHVGRRYLRLDRSVTGWARLSPSIRREFRTYSVFGRDDDPTVAEDRASALESACLRIGRRKTETARAAMDATMAGPDVPAGIAERVAVIIAGDVTYGMAHDVPRPEPSTGQMVRGSDLDVIVVATDDVSAEELQALDRAVHARKHYVLFDPEAREEIDYVIKSLSTVRDQLEFDSFEHAVASKILHEGWFLCGNRDVFAQVKGLVDDRGVPKLLDDLTERARDERRVAEQRLLEADGSAPLTEHLKLFYTKEEHEEIY